MSRTSRLPMFIVLSAMVVASVGAVPAAAGGGCHAQELTDKAATEVKVHENCFSPTVTRVDVGDRVTWFSGEFEAPHTVTGVAGGFGSADLPANGRASFTFAEAGVYPYACLLHAGMVGAVVVGDGAAADAEGTPAADADVTTGAASSATPSTPVLPWALGLLTAGGVAAAALAGILLRRRRMPPAPAA